MIFRTPVERQETSGSLGHITWFKCIFIILENWSMMKRSILIGSLSSPVWIFQ